MQVGEVKCDPSLDVCSVREALTEETFLGGIDHDADREIERKNTGLTCSESTKKVYNMERLKSSVQYVSKVLCSFQRSAPSL